MNEYGQIINPYYDPSKNRIYEAFYNYFNNPIVTKIKNVEKFSVYMSKIYSMIGNSYRYLVLLVDIDNNDIGFNQHMKNSEWVSLQTRTLDDVHNIPIHKYQSVLIPELKQKIYIKSRDEKQSVYDCEDFPLKVTILHTKKNYTMQYQNIGTITSAIETYQTIFNFK